MKSFEAAEDTQNESSRTINIRNKAFWDGIAARDKQLEDRGFELWEDPLNKDQHKELVLKEQASKGGRSSRGDWLTSQISLIVDTNADISEDGLRKRLSNLPDVEFHDADDRLTSPARATFICYFASDRERKLLCSGLKDRLSRAKKIRAKQIARMT